jgi:hypothetical protein
VRPRWGNHLLRVLWVQRVPPPGAAVHAMVNPCTVPYCLLVQSGSSCSFQRVFLGKKMPCSIDHHPCLGGSKVQQTPPLLQASAASFALEPCSASRDLPLGEVSPVASLLSPKRDRTLHSAVSCSSSFLGLNLQSFHLPIPKAKCLPRTEPTESCWLFMAAHRLCPLFPLLWPKHHQLTPQSSPGLHRDSPFCAR